LSNVVRLCVTDTILAVEDTPSGPDIITIPPGAMIETTDSIRNSSANPVTYEGRELLVFTKDIRDRTARLSSAEA
jgi:hypothetical protein